MVTHNYSVGKLVSFVNESLLSTDMSTQVSPGVDDNLRNLLRRYYTVKEGGIIQYQAGYVEPRFMMATIIDPPPGMRDPLLRFRFRQTFSGEDKERVTRLAINSRQL